MRTQFTKSCIVCNQVFTVDRERGQRFCSPQCRGKALVARIITSARIKPLAECFWEKVQKDESCWLWTGGTNACGYGTIGVKGRCQLAHRVSWELHNGPVPDGMCVLHNCPGGDNPACVNPAHLWLGTHHENMLDRGAKGRDGGPLRRGELNANAKLTAEDVLEIREQFARGIKDYKGTAERYRVSPGLIYAVVQRRAWKHL